MREAIDNRIQRVLNAEYIEEVSGVITETKAQLSQCFNGERKTF